MEIERTKRLKKFSYDPDTFSSIKDRIVTWGNQSKVEIIKVIKSTSGPRLVGVIEGEEYDQIFTYTTEGKCVGQNPDMDIYVDESIEVWFNLSRSSDGLHILASCAYYSKKEAEKYKDPVIHFDTICAKTILTQNEKVTEMPSINNKMTSKPITKTKMAAYIFSSGKNSNSTEKK